MYKFRVVEQLQFLTGTLAGMTVEGGFPLCAISDYNMEREIGRIRTSCGTRDKYRVVSARIEEIPDERCDECGTPGTFYDGLCYQCQCELHAIGAYNMDGE